MTIAYEDRTSKVLGVEGQYCQDCGEAIFDQVNGDKYAQALKTLRDASTGELGLK